MSQMSPVPPSTVAPPTRSDTPPQQASTQPDDGAEVHYHNEHPGEERAGQPSGVGASDVTATEPKKVPFKEQVIGVAKKTRGTMLGKSELKNHGEKILEGKATSTDDPGEL